MNSCHVIVFQAAILTEIFDIVLNKPNRDLKKKMVKPKGFIRLYGTPFIPWHNMLGAGVLDPFTNRI